MCEGEKRKLVVPADMGYGARGAPPKIPGKIFTALHITSFLMHVIFLQPKTVFKSMTSYKLNHCNV